MFDVNKVKKDFPILSRIINGKNLAYLDNAATSQKPSVVLSAVNDYYLNSNANVHRGSHTLADEATFLYEKSRETVVHFIGAQKVDELVFVRNTTEALNLVVNSFALQYLKPDDEVLIGIWEHHANLVPWQEVCRKTGAKLVYINLTQDYTFDWADFKAKLSTKTKILALGQASNVLGTIFPVKEIIDTAKRFGVVTVVDGAQSAPHMSVNVKELGCDFFAFSGHKMLGPMGIGALYVKTEMYQKMTPFMTGGGMILEVDKDKAVWEKEPYKYEAGTPNVGGAIGFATAIEYIKSLGMDAIRDHEIELTTYTLEKFQSLKSLAPSFIMLGPTDAKARTGLVSFYSPVIHAHDLAAILDQHGVAARSGYHCAQPLHIHLGIGPTCRASWYLYNTKSDLDALFEGLKEASRILG